MKQTKTFLIVTALVFGMGVAKLSAEKQPHMEAALKNLQEAEANLNKATDDKGGNKKAALGHIKAAIESVKKGIAFDNKK